MTNKKFPKDYYLNLLKLVLTNYIYGEFETGAALALQKIGGLQVANFLKRWNLQLTYRKPFVKKERAIGSDWPAFAHTMIGIKGLDVIEFCLRDIIRKKIPGDTIEAGVWRGGASIFMKAVLTVFGETNRTVWVADSYAGLPPPNKHNFPHDATSDLHQVGFLAVAVDEVKNNFRKYGLLDRRVKFLKGWFKDTLPNAPIKHLALLRADGDMYESTMDILDNLYSKITPGGYVIIDDYYTIPACRQAVTDFRSRGSIFEKIRFISHVGGVYWQKKGP
ncbi:MAG: TylF/MycF/NovP-related O-methyltransferase [Patescibacteria group bacterium]